MIDLLPITLEDQILCVQRELALRRRVYPRWVEQGRMKLDTSEREIAVMTRVLETLQGLRHTPPDAA